jgi:hypothetical protein
VEEGVTNEDLDFDDNDAMDVASDEDDAIVHVTAGGILPPRPSSLGGRDEAPVVRRRTPKEGGDGDGRGVRRRRGRSSSGGKGRGRASGRATTVAAAPIANEVMVANLGKIADKQHAAPVVIAPPALLSGEGRDGGVFVFVIIDSSSYYNQPW